jgi:hypothetical protein
VEQLRDIGRLERVASVEPPDQQLEKRAGNVVHRRIPTRTGWSEAREVLSDEVDQELSEALLHHLPAALADDGAEEAPLFVSVFDHATGKGERSDVGWDGLRFAEELTERVEPADEELLLVGEVRVERGPKSSARSNAGSKRSR